MKSANFLNVSCVLLLIITLFIPTEVQATKEKTVALVMMSLSNPFWLKVDQGAREYARDNNIRLEVFGIDRETDVEHQINIVESLIIREYDAIILAPNDAKRLVPIVHKAISRGIIVITIDNPLDQKSLNRYGITVPFIGPDNFQGGEMVGGYVRSKLKGEGEVLVIEGVSGVSNSDQRKNGFIKGVSRDSSIKVESIKGGNWHSDEAFAVVIETLKKRGQVDAIFCANDQMAMGALQALELFGLSGEVILAGYDNLEGVRAEMRRGKIHATVEQHSELMGEYGVRSAWERLKGKPVALYQSTPIDLITSDHMGKEVIFSISDKKSPFYSKILASAEKEAELMGINLKVLDAENDDAKQLVAVFSAIEQGADLLLITPTNGEAMLPVIDAVQSRNIPVITVDRKIPSDNILGHISSKNVDGGRLVARFIAESLGGVGHILELEGIPGNSSGIERGIGFDQVIEDHDQLSVLIRETAGFDRERARAVVTKLLNEGLYFDAVFAHNDEMVLGAIDAFDEAEIDLPKVLVGYDGIEQARDLIKQGKLSATIAQHPEAIGKLAVDSAVQYFRGGKVSQEIAVDLVLLNE